MKKDECFHLGTITRMHGVRGEVKIYLDVDDPSQYRKLESVLVEINEKLVPFSIAAIQVTQKNQAILKLKDITTYEAAEKLLGNDLYLPLSMLPKLDENKFYIHDVIGFTLIDEKAGELGKISDIVDFGPNRLVQVYYKNRELLLPLNDDTIVKLDMEKQELTLRSAEGLIDLFLTDEHSRED
jgi:16S rRNA processing protein RimM